MTVDLTPPVAELTRVVSGIRDDQLTAPTPNDGRDVATLLAHVHGLAIAFRDAAYKIDGPTTSTSPTEAPIRAARGLAGSRSRSGWPN